MNTNLDDPCVPTEVLDSKVAFDIKDMYQTWFLPVPSDLQIFIDKHNPDIYCQWEQLLLSLVPIMSDELLARWISVMYTGSFRNELREILVERVSKLYKATVKL